MERRREGWRGGGKDGEEGKMERKREGGREGEE